MGKANDARIMNRIPKRKREAVASAWEDEEGLWVTLNEGWCVRDYFAKHTIHEDSLTELGNVAKRIAKEDTK